MTAEPTVFVVDDDPAMRKSLARLLQEAGLRAAVFADAESFLGAYREDMPGCLILDVKMPGMSGVELHRRLVEDGIALPVIIITGHGDVSMATDSMHRGAVDFVEKPFRQDPLLERVRRSLELDARRRAEQAERDDLQARFDKLTEREREVVDLVVTGVTNKAIAGRLGVSPQAIDARRARAMAKLRVTNVPELVQVFVRWRDGVPSAEAAR